MSPSTFRSRVAVETTDRGRFYVWRGDRFWSVTTMLSAYPKPWLGGWNAREVATAAVEGMEEGWLLGRVKADREGAIDDLKRSPWRKTERAAKLGTLVHETAEAHVLGRPLPEFPEGTRERMNAFLSFLADWNPSYHVAEAKVFNRTERYAGQLDAIVELHGRPVLLDIKTGKDVYAEVALQLAAYRRAEFIAGADGAEEPMREVAAAVVLHLRKDGTYRLVEVDAGEEAFRAFVNVREVYRYVNDIAKHALLGDYPTTWDGQQDPNQLALVELSEIPF